MLKRGFQFAPGYRLQEFLGRGQFGQVWRATAPGGAATAAKFIDLSDGQGQKEYEGVKRVKQIRHANLMPITAIWLLDGEGKVIEELPDEANETIDLSAAASSEAGFHDRDVEPSWLVVAMLLGGKSLQARLRECVKDGLPGIPPKELIAYMDEVAKGIDFLNAPQHDLGDGLIAIQHSDIKPANIVLIGSSAVVCDFGLARILTRNQVTATSTSGTPAYMAPEAIGHKPARTSDQYSLAVTYYHLRTGTLPIDDGSIWEVLDAHRYGKLKFGLVPEAEQHVLRKATDLDWKERFESCLEMVEALREALRVEGHTKPSFLPPSRKVDSVTAGGASTDAADPSATLDVAANQTTADQDTANQTASNRTVANQTTVDQASRSTQPFVSVEPSTKQDGFEAETLPELDASALASSPQTQVSSHWLKRHRVLFGSLGGCVLGLFLAIIAIKGGVGARPSNPDRTPVEVKSFDELYSEAIALLDTDANAASRLFDQALESNPKWMPSAARLKGHKGPVMQMSLTGDGRRLISVADGAVPFVWDLRKLQRPWETSSGADLTDADSTELGSIEPLQLIGHDTLLNDFSVLPGSNRLVTAGLDSIARVWIVSQDDASPLELKTHRSGIEAVAWRGSLPIAATASSDLTLGVWRIGPPSEDDTSGTIENQRQISVGQSLTHLVSDTSGRFLIASTNGNDPIEPEPDVLVYRWDDLLEGKGQPAAVSLKTRSAKRVAALAKRSIVVTGDLGGTVSLYEIGEANANFIAQSDEHQADVEALKVVDFNDTDVIVSAAADGSVSRWIYGATQNIVTRFFSNQSVSCIDVTPDGRFVAVGVMDGTVWLWDTQEDAPGKGAFRINVGVSVDSVIIDAIHGRLIGGCDDGVIRVWNLRELKLMLMTDPTPSSAKDADQEIRIQAAPIT
ncbi:MAG: protein kinase [Planctomycetota bacterium]